MNMAEVPQLMIKMPETHPATERIDASRDELVDLLTSEVSRSLELNGALFFLGEFTAPWAVRSRDRAEFALAIHPDARRAILFHVVLEGPLRIAMPNGRSELLGVGDVVIFPYADQHVMQGRTTVSPVALETLLPPLPWRGPPRLRHGDGGERTSIACGYLFSRDLNQHPILAAMPELMVVRAEDTAFRNWLITNVRFALAESLDRDWHASALARRLPELLFLQCLSHYARRTELQEWSWLRAAMDPLTGRTLSLIHRQPRRAWNLHSLCRESGTSRTVLNERFNRYLGVSPMQYLVQWRLQLAAQALKSGNRALGEIAFAAGYGSESAFSRAFKRWAGVSPSQYRRGS